ncbi:MAG TPA: YceI family protein [Luteimonas sp.]|nr:YceI family protein [Luteimonas sp.]
MTTPFATPAAVAAALVALIAGPALAADYVQAPGSSLAFASRYDGETFTGTFPGFVTRLAFDPAEPAKAALDVTIPLAGARTGNGDRDQTLQGAEFFNAARFTEARYSARGFRHLGGSQYAADGTLSLRGVSKPVTLIFTWTAGTRPVLAGKATVKRLDFGVGSGDWADTGTIPADVAISTRVVFKAK